MKIYHLKMFEVTEMYWKTKPDPSEFSHTQYLIKQ